MSAGRYCQAEFLPAFLPKFLPKFQKKFLLKFLADFLAEIASDKARMLWTHTNPLGMAHGHACPRP